MKRNLMNVVRGALIAASVACGTPVLADPVGGTKFGEESVSARSTITYDVKCYADEETRVTVLGDGSSDLDVYVYDSKGNLITKDEDTTDQCSCAFRAFVTTTFTVEVVNRGNVRNHYFIRVS